MSRSDRKRHEYRLRLEAEARKRDDVEEPDEAEQAVHRAHRIEHQALWVELQIQQAMPRSTISMRASSRRGVSSRAAPRSSPPCATRTRKSAHGSSVAPIGSPGRSSALPRSGPLRKPPLPHPGGDACDDAGISEPRYPGLDGAASSAGRAPAARAADPARPRPSAPGPAARTPRCRVRTHPFHASRAACSRR